MQERNAMDRPLSARSLVASTLLGCHPPRLRVRALVHMGHLYGMAEGTIRVALSRMVSAGEVEVDGGDYRLTARLVARQARQEEGWHPVLREWSGSWTMALVVAGRRNAPARAELRAAMTTLRLADLREGVWLRPDNLDPRRSPEAREVADAQCRWLEARPGRGEQDDERLAGELWDLTAWAKDAAGLRREMERLIGPLDAGNDAALPRGGLVSAAVLRHFLHDPLLPLELLPARWPGDSLRADYDRFEVALRRLLRDWERRQRVSDSAGPDRRLSGLSRRVRPQAG
jgi:phenylacetic acid degradation operon negative regulatory protein